VVLGEVVRQEDRPDVGDGDDHRERDAAPAVDTLPDRAAFEDHRSDVAAADVPAIEGDHLGCDASLDQVAGDGLLHDRSPSGSGLARSSEAPTLAIANRSGSDSRRAAASQ
jgi:hypothetical protein